MFCKNFYNHNLKIKMAAKKSEETGKLKSLADELKEKISKEEEEKNLKKEEREDDAKKASAKTSKKDVKEDLKQADKKDNDNKETLIPLEDYIKCAVHLGTKVITPHMRKFVYKRRADGLSVINTIFIDKKLREAIDFVSKYNPEKIYLVCKREAGWPAAKKFGGVTGIRVFTKKYPPGITTNLELEDFFESELTVICDPWIDKNALNDTAKLKKPVVALCDTNNFTTNITKIIPCNNKAKKSIGCILYILAREYCKAKGIDFKAELEDFTGKLEEIPA